MNFKEALAKLHEGHCVYRKEWTPQFVSHFFLEIEDGKIKAFKEHCEEYIYENSILESNNWIVVGEEKEMSFVDAIDLLQQNFPMKQKKGWEGMYLRIDKITKQLLLHGKTEMIGFTPSFKCLTSNDWEIYEGLLQCQKKQ